MVNGNLPRRRQAELFAGCDTKERPFLPAVRGPVCTLDLSFINIFPRGTTSALHERQLAHPAAWESRPRVIDRNCRDRRQLPQHRGESTDGECASRRLVATDGAYA